MVLASLLLTVASFGVPQEAFGEEEVSETDAVEATVEALAPWLRDVERWIATGEGTPLGDDPKLLFAPLFGEGSRTTTGGFDVLRRRDPSFDPESEPDATSVGELEKVTLDQLRSALGGPDDPTAPIEVRIKVIGVAGPGTQVRLRIEASSDGWQVVALADSFVAKKMTGQECFGVEPAPDAPWHCGAFMLRTIERVTSRAPAFVERTAGVFAHAPEAARRLGVGSDRWAQRLDDPALSAWFGHQGLAAGDVNGDGFDDLYVAMPSGLPNMLLVQQPDGTVRDVAAERGVAWLDDTKGVLLVDVTDDGIVDVVSALGHVIVVQEGRKGKPVQAGRDEGPFEIASWAVAPDEVPFYGIDAGDIDGDGDLDLFGARYVRTQYGDSVPVPFEDARNGPRNCLFLNEDGRFRDVSEVVGLDADGGRFSLQGTFVDHDGDGDLELYVVNDFGRNQLFEWSGGRLVDLAGRIGVEDQGAGMGASWADYDRDGDLDLYVTNMYSSAGRRVAFQPTFAEGRDEDQIEGIRRLSLGNSLLRNDDGHFVQCADDAGVRMGRWAWGAVFVDLDADGWDDLVSPAGFLTGPKPGDL